MLYSVDSRDIEEVLRILEAICRDTGSFCYRPLDSLEPLVSLTWAETLQYIPSSCYEDESCAAKILQVFGETLQITLSRDYVFVIDVDSLKRTLSTVTSATLQTKLAPVRHY